MVDTAKKVELDRGSRQPTTDRDRLAAAWREENREALKVHAEFIERHGTLAERLKALG
jgi:hypothetical protein